jgi:PST family polysaccharide transporter
MRAWRERQAARALALSKSLVVRQMSWLVLARLFQIGANVAATLVMARVLGPERLGVLSLATTIAVVMATLGTLGLEQIAMREFASGGESGSAHATRSLLLLRLVGALLGGALVLAMLFVPLPQPGALGPLLVVLALLPLFQGGDIAEWQLVANQRVRTVAQATMASAMVFAVAKITLALVHPDLFAFALAVLAEAALRSLLLAFASRGLWTPHRTGNASLAMAGQFLREGGPLLASTLAIFVYIRLDQFMIASMVGARAVGQFVAVANISEMQLVAAMALSRSVMPSLVQAYERSPAEFEALMSRCMRAGFYLMLASSLLLSFASPWLLALMFGPGYEGGARALSIHAFMAPFAMLGVLSSTWFVLNRNTGHALGRTLFGAGVNVVLNLLLIPRLGIAGAAIATLAAQSCASLFYDALAADTRRLFKLKLRALVPTGR